jgi:hypothetical protein
MRTSRPVLEAAAVNAPAKKTYENRIADLIRRLGSDFEGEIIATWRGLKQLLTSRDVTFTDLGDAVEKLATGGLEQDATNRIFDEGYAKGFEDTERKYAETQVLYSFRVDGSKVIALHYQRQKHLIESKHHQFVDEVASRTTRRREPSEKQGRYLLSFFRGLGGRIS